MPQIKPFPRNPQNVLGDLAKFLYENVLLYCESNDLSGLSNNTHAKDYTRFIKNNKIELEYRQNKNSPMFKEIKKSKEVYIDKNYAVQEIQDKIIFTTIPKNVFKNLFNHIRNAFAHNQIKIDGEYVLMYDQLPSSKNKMTMVGHIKRETLKNLIICLKSIKKK